MTTVTPIDKLDKSKVWKEELKKIS
jgi:hypothetical protein